MTGLFADGLINTIVGTAALLGEGWDAPSINTLILARVVATYVTSNQMRGRAIRSLEQDPHKVANIWHLACLEPRRDDPAALPVPLGTALRVCENSDMHNLRQRFQAFVGLSLEQPVLESGVERLGLHGCSDRISAPFLAPRLARISAPVYVPWRPTPGASGVMPPPRARPIRGLAETPATGPRMPQR